MTKYILITILLLGCNPSSTNTNQYHLIEDSVQDLVVKFNNEMQNSDRAVKVVGLKVHSCFMTKYVELTSIDHYYSLEMEQPCYHTFVNKIPVLIWCNERDVLNAPRVSNEVLEKIAVDYTLNRDTPPPTSIGVTWLYRLDLPPTEYFAVTDTVFSYDDISVTVDKLNDYLGCSNQVWY